MLHVCSLAPHAAPPPFHDSFPVPACRRRARSSRQRLRSAFIAAWISVAAITLSAPAGAQPAAVRPVAHLGSAADLAAVVAEASRQFGIPTAWIRAVMRAESFGDVHAVSPKGAMGLMQIMPDTWAALRQRYHLGADPYDIHDNILAGAAYLRELRDRYGIPGFLAAYNAGPARWEDHLATGRPLPAETRVYLVKLAPIVDGGATDDTALLASIVRSWTEASLFPKPSPSGLDAKPTVAASHPTDAPGISPPQDWTGLAPQSDGLFVAVSSAGRPQ
jgi:soluble lytic murein transglycosylase-like protein